MLDAGQPLPALPQPYDALGVHVLGAHLQRHGPCVPDRVAGKCPALGPQHLPLAPAHGADVVYHAAGGSGNGVFNAAKAAGKKAIGVDSDQAKNPQLAAVKDVILTSMLKKVDVAVYDFIKAESTGAFQAGNKVFDLKAGGVDYSTTGGKIDDIKAQLDDYKAKIIAGSITVPTKP